MVNEIKDALHGWIPYKLTYQKETALLHWLNVGDTAFTAPFFDETIATCKGLSQNTQRFRVISEINMLLEWAPLVDGVEPTAFIFHVSRCGSTLVSQLLSMIEENISLSEVPVFDEILGLRFKNFTDTKTNDAALPAAIRFYGQKRSGNEKRLFIKTDSWHLMYYRQLRTLYPKTPFVIIYREPVPVLRSQQKQKGMHAVRGLIAPTLFGFDEEYLNNIHPNDYMALVLQKYYEVIIDISRKDECLLLTNYNEGIETIMEKITAFTGTEISDAYKKRFSERSGYHSKKVSDKFLGDVDQEEVTSPFLANLNELYQQIETLKNV